MSLRVEVLELFAEVARVPSHVAERRAYRQVLLALSKRQAEKERYRLTYAADRFLRRRYYVEPLPLVVACCACRRTFNHSTGLMYHQRHCHGT